MQLSLSTAIVRLYHDQVLRCSANLALSVASHTAGPGRQLLLCKIQRIKGGERSSEESFKRKCPSVQRPCLKNCPDYRWMFVE
jgi:hypothetical protein